MIDVKKEIKFLKILIGVLIGLLIVSGGIAFYFNQYLSNVYKEKIKQEKRIRSKLQSQINEKINKISNLLEGKDLAKIKNMSLLYNVYFKNRLQTLPKDLILELLEEILPPNAKIGNSIKIGNNTNINLVLYTTNVDGLDVLYNKFKYYSDVLHLLNIRGFDTITLNRNNPEIMSIVNSNSKYVYKTTIQLKINEDALLKYYSALYHPVKNYDFFKQIYGPNIVEPNRIPNNITISDTIKLHELLQKKNKKNNDDQTDNTENTN